MTVKAGEIAPWFNETGGGIQYVLPDTIDELLEAGIISIPVIKRFGLCKK